MGTRQSDEWMHQGRMERRPKPPAPQARGFRAALLGIAFVAILGTGAGFLANNGTLTTTIAPASGLPGGVLANATAVSSTVRIASGPAATVAGVELYRIHVGNPVDSNRLWITFDWLNPNDALQVLHNPSASIRVGVYEPVSSAAACSTTAYSVNDPVNGSITVCQDPGPQASATLTTQIASTVLMPTVSNQPYLYVVASITTPGHMPPGSQSSVTSLQYYAAVHGL